jgi:hypothetical protein
MYISDFKKLSKILQQYSELCLPGQYAKECRAGQYMSTNKTHRPWVHHSTADCSQRGIDR